MITALNFLISVINSIFSSIFKKILVGLVVFILLHALVITIGTNLEGDSISYGTALAKTAKMDLGFIFTNIGKILNIIWENICDFFKTL